MSLSNITPVALDTTRRAQDRAQEALVAILGALASAREPSSAEAERWVAHLELLTPAPGRRHPSSQRDYVGAATFVRTVLAEQRAAFDRAVADLREVVQAFSTQIAHTVADDPTTTMATRLLVQRLDQTVRRGPAADLGPAALETIDAMNDILVRRETGRRRRAHQTGTVLQTLRQELVEARRTGETDALTQLPNRRALEAALNEAKLANEIFDAPACLLLIDLDHFKKINDTYGHNGGDAVLRAVGAELKKAFPRARDCAGRYGGEEFAVVLRDTPLVDATRMAEALRRDIRAAEILFDGQRIPVTASIGVAAIAPQSTTTAWLQAADARLYRAKAAGRDRVISEASGAERKTQRP